MGRVNLQTMDIPLNEFCNTDEMFFNHIHNEG